VTTRATESCGSCGALGVGDGSTLGTGAVEGSEAGLDGVAAGGGVGEPDVAGADGAGAWAEQATIATRRGSAARGRRRFMTILRTGSR
jgi:hypothetical protein